MTERLLKDCVRTGHIKWCRAHQTKTHQERRLQTLRHCDGASITYVVGTELQRGDGIVCLVVFLHSTGKRLAARMLCRTITQLRSRRFTHLGERVKVMAPHGGLSSLFHTGRGLSPSAVRAKRCATTPRHGMSKRAAHLHGACCARGHVPWYRGTTRAVMSCNIVDIVPSIRVRLRHTTQTSTPTPSLAVLREQFQPAALPHASRRNTNHTSTDCDVRTTWFLTLNQNVALA